MGSIQTGKSIGALAQKSARGGEEGENVAAGEDAGDGEGPAPKARKKRKTDTRGAEDREEAREDKEAEAEDDGDKDLHEKNDDAPSEKSGMYSDEDSLSDPDDAGQEEDGNAKNPVEGDE